MANKAAESLRFGSQKILQDSEFKLSSEWCSSLFVCLESVPVLALPAPWMRFLRRPLTAIQTHMKKGKGYNEITIY